MLRKIFIVLVALLCLINTNVGAGYLEKFIVNCDVLNVREQPNANARILGTITKGEVVQGINSNESWTPITYKDSEAFVFSMYLDPENSNKEITTNVENSRTYTDEELDLLSRVIYSEAGSDWLTDEHQLAVGSVVLNRVADNRFPNTLKDVIYQRGQYACVSNGSIKKEPNARAINNAKYLLENGVTIPTNVVWQAQFKQGKGVWKYIQGHYFCY